MTKYIFITGGVISGLGKGVTSASIGNLLKSQGFSVYPLKLDPYLNLDPGLLSPIEHGETFITKDGWKCDLDLGHYERFIDAELNKNSNYSSGRIFQDLFQKEQNGDFHGSTIQIVPHVTNHIIEILENTAKENKPDFILTEIGGTVGDIESRAHIYAISQFALEHPGQVLFVHIAFVPYLTASKEYKSKPSQFSIAELRSFGINPNLLLLRSSGEIDKSIVSKVAKTSFLNPENVISVPDTSNIYEIPLYLYSNKLLDKIYKHFQLTSPINPKALTKWKSFVNKYNNLDSTQLNLLLIGENVVLEDAYLSTIASLKIAATHFKSKANLIFKHPTFFENEDFKNYILTNKIDGVLLLPGNTDFNKSFIIKSKLANILKDLKIPTLAYDDAMLNVLFMQAVSKKLLSFDTNPFKPFETKINESLIKVDLLKPKVGSHLVVPISKKSLIADIYKNSPQINPRYHSKNWLNPLFNSLLEDDNFILSSYDSKQKIAQSLEIKNHPFYLSVAYHPEFDTRVLTSNPLFDKFIQTCLKIKTTI